MRRRIGYIAVMVMLSSALSSGIAVYLAFRADKKWCELITTLDQGYRRPPGPSTDVGRKLAADVNKLRHELGCAG